MACDESVTDKHMHEMAPPFWHKTFGTKAVFIKEGRRKIVNPSLMDKLKRIERVSE